MRFSLLAIPVFMLLVAPGADAQSSNYPASDTDAIATVQVTAPPHGVRVSEDETRAVSGMYAMSNGWSMHVRPALNGLVVSIDDQRPMRLIALSPDTYVTRNGSVTMDFNLGGNADAMQMSYVPSSNLAAVIVVRTTMASR
jgi:hypothetical protein